MNKYMKIISIALFVPFYTLCVYADIEGPYTFSVAGGDATITRFDAGYAGELFITNRLGGCPVKTIGNFAFSDLLNLTSVTIPDSVTSLLDGAFWGCYNITNFTIGNAVSIIEKRVFRQCRSLSTINIPASVNSIGIFQFDGCSNLTSINVAEINAYYKSIDGVLFNKSGTVLIEFPRGKAGHYNIPDGVTTIRSNAFFGRGNLSSVSIPYSVTNIEFLAFSESSSLTNINVHNDNIYYKCLDGVLFNNVYNKLIQYPCGRMGDYAIPYGVTSIEPYSFSRAHQLTSILIPDGVASIGNHAFYVCTNLVNVVFPESVTFIGLEAFAWCRSLTTVYFKGNCPSREAATFHPTSATIYYLPGSTGWPTNISLRPTVLWNPSISQVSIDGGNCFYSITGTPFIPIGIHVSTNLLNNIWEPLIPPTNIPSSGTLFLQEEMSSAYTSLFFRIYGP